MIKIEKSVVVPSILTTQGSPDKVRLCAQYDANPIVYQKKFSKLANPFKLEINDAIYGDHTVKAQLILDQHQKCCFCEAFFLSNGYGDVEHFRPKGGYQQVKTDLLGKPGYYWLAYEWNNLLFSCDICNRSYKKNIFPLSTTYRALNHHDKLEDDNNCLLINPTVEDPELHITFNKEIPAGKTAKGIQSIETYGIDRKTLNDVRRKHLEDTKANLTLSVIGLHQLTEDQKEEIKTLTGATTDLELQEIIDTAVKYKNNCAKVEFPFTNMVRSNFPHLPRN